MYLDKIRPACLPLVESVLENAHGDLYRLVASGPTKVQIDEIYRRLIGTVGDVHMKHQQVEIVLRKRERESRC